MNDLIDSVLLNLPIVTILIFQDGGAPATAEGGMREKEEEWRGEPEGHDRGQEEMARDENFGIGVGLQGEAETDG